MKVVSHTDATNPIELIKLTLNQTHEDRHMAHTHTHAEHMYKKHSHASEGNYCRNTPTPTHEHDTHTHTLADQQA